MKLLIDTHLLLWAAAGDRRLPRAAREAMADPENDMVFSIASLWEIAIKRGLRQADFEADPRLLRRGAIDNGYRELPILGEHAVAVGALPLIHKDPFDRMLISQAQVEGMVLLTMDKVLVRYPAPVRLV